MDNHNSHTSTSLRLLQLQLDLAESELRQLRSSRRSPLLILYPIFLAIFLVLAFPSPTTQIESNSFSLTNSQTTKN